MTLKRPAHYIAIGLRIAVFRVVVAILNADLTIQRDSATLTGGEHGYPP